MLYDSNLSSAAGGSTTGPTVRGLGVEPTRVTPMAPRWALALGCVVVAVIEAAVLAFGRDLSPAVPALLLLVPVIGAGVLGGRLVAIAVAMVAAVGFSMVLPPFGSPGVELGHDVLTLVLFIVVAGAASVLLTSVALSDRRRLTAELATVDALRQVDADRAALLRSVSHDLRTPLATISAAATDLRGFDHPRETREELLDLVIDESGRLDRIVGNMLSLSRIEAGALLPERQPVDLTELVATSAQRLQRVTSRVRLEQSIEPGLPLVSLDYSQFDQVVGNLLENAVRHSPPGATVCITVRTTGRVVRLAVSDEGPGFDRSVRDRLFEPFSSATGSGSSGIGLAICRSIVEAHGGSISASEPGAGGATIVVEVPLDG